MPNHQDGFATNITTNQSAGVTTTPLNSIPTVDAPFWIALDATNINGKYEPVFITSKTATNINHAATAYEHTTAEEVRMVVPAAELNILNSTAEGTMNNGRILPTVNSNNLTLALKTLSGGDPSITDPVQITLGGAVRTITSALSVTVNAGTNWMNLGSSELATKEVDLFAYLGYNATDGVVIGASRIPFATQYSDFSTTTTNEKYLAVSTRTNASATDPYAVIGRFGAILSGGAGYTWSVPTYTPSNLVQRPIYEIRNTTAIAPVIANVSGTATASYKLVNNTVFLSGKIAITNAGAGNIITFSLPFTSANNAMTNYGAGKFLDAGTAHYTLVATNIPNTSVVSFMENANANSILGNRSGLGNTDTIEFSITYCI